MALETLKEDRDARNGAIGVVVVLLVVLGCLLSVNKQVAQPNRAQAVPSQAVQTATLNGHAQAVH
jgi:hypothetical protein